MLLNFLLGANLPATLHSTEHRLLFDVTTQPMGTFTSSFLSADSKTLYLGFSGDHVKYLGPLIQCSISKRKTDLRHERCSDSPWLLGANEN